MPEVPERLRQTDWESLLPRARLWAHQFHRRYLANVRAAPEPDDLLQDAIVKLYTGRRKLPDHVSLLTVLINIMQSDIWNFLTKEGYVKKGGKGRKGWGRHVGLDMWTLAIDSSNEPIEHEMRSLRDEVNRLVEGDTLVEQITALLFKDPGLKPRDMAKMLGTTVKEINKAQKRLRRKLNVLRAEVTSTGGRDVN